MEILFDGQYRKYTLDPRKSTLLQQLSQSINTFWLKTILGKIIFCKKNILLHEIKDGLYLTVMKLTRVLINELS